jgi:murein DD-endopeptidase MepM/ murein hydrolase activator NlpD
MGKSNNHILLVLFFTFILVIVALVSVFYGYKTDDIRVEQQRLTTQNYQLKSAIKKKIDEYEKIEDKINEIKSFIDPKQFSSNNDVKNLLSTLSLDTKELILNSLPSGYPSNSKRVTSKFGFRIHPIYKTKKFHHGIDFAGKLKTPIISTADGIVEFSGMTKGYGNLVVLSHNFGFKTAYGHMLKNLKVKKGEFVKKGDVIGYLGNSGISTGPHLHYEVKYIKNSLDPKRFIDFSMEHFNDLFYHEKKIAWSGLVKAILNQYGKFNERVIATKL